MVYFKANVLLYDLKVLPHFISVRISNVSTFVI